MQLFKKENAESVEDQQKGFEPKGKFKLSLESHFGGGLWKFNFKFNNKFVKRIVDSSYLSTNSQHWPIDYSCIEENDGRYRIASF